MFSILASEQSVDRSEQVTFNELERTQSFTLYNNTDKKSSSFPLGFQTPNSGSCFSKVVRNECRVQI